MIWSDISVKIKDKVFFCVCSLLNKPTAPENGTHHTVFVLRVVREPACKRRELCVVLFCQSNYTLYTTLLVHCGFRAGSSRPIHSHSTLSLLSSVLWVSLRICIFQ